MKKPDAAGLCRAVVEWIRLTVRSTSRDGVVVGLSGGIDSAVAAALAVEALGPGSVLGLLLPCDSSEEDTRDGLRTAVHLGIQFRTIDLSPVLHSLVEAAGLQSADNMTIANMKSRLRMTTLYAHSIGRLVLGTGNYSEVSVGYWTKWGDGAADLLPLARLFKDEVRLLAAYLGLPDWILERVPSAGLWPGQSDETEMGATYDQIRAYILGDDPGLEASRRIQAMILSSGHKRDPIPFFDARGWIEQNG